MREFDEAELTAEVVRSFADTPDPRLKRILSSLVQHAHAFVRDVDLTFDEWLFAIDFLARTGRKRDAVRQEFILLSDTLGVSMLVDAINHRERAGATQTTVLGPFHVGEHRPTAHGSDISPGVAGETMIVESVVTDTAGKPIAGAEIDVWHADPAGLYDAQQPGYAMDAPSMRAKFHTGADGGFHFRTVLPASYPIPMDGPVGEMIAAAARHPMRPAHIHFYVTAPGYEPLVTHVFMEGDEYLDSDVVFGVKNELVCQVEARPAGTPLPDGTATGAPWHLMRYRFRLRPAAGA